MDDSQSQDSAKTLPAELTALLEARDAAVRDDAWAVRTKLFPDNVAVCIPDEDKANAPPRSYYHMPFEITVRLK